MSIQAISAVFDTDVDGTERLVLIALANHSSKDTETLFPSVARLAHEAHVSERTCQRVLGRFREAGYIEQIRPASRTVPATYRLHLDRIPTQAPFKLKGDSVAPFGGDPRGDKSGGGGVTESGPKGDIAVAPEPSNRQENQESPLSPQGGEGVLFVLPEESEDSKAAFERKCEKEFEEHFWPRYPKRDGGNPKQPALKAYIRQRRRYELDWILQGLRADIEHWSATNKIGTQFIPLAATWINQARWDAKAGAGATKQRELTPGEAGMIKSWSALRDALARAGISMDSMDAQKRQDFCHRNGINPILLQG